MAEYSKSGLRPQDLYLGMEIFGQCYSQPIKQPPRPSP